MPSVKLVAVTTPTIPEIKSAEDLIVYCARVSNPSNQLNFDTSDKLLKYCIRNHHWSVFAQADMTVEIKTSRAVSAQIIRHKSAEFQEYSTRYSPVQEFEPTELRKQGATNRQVGDEPFDPIMDISYDGMNIVTPIHASEMVDNAIEKANELYNMLIDAGVAKECARMILPMCSQTTLYMKNNVRNWLAYLNVRLHNTCQKEHRDVAEGIRDLFIKEFPVISSCFNNFSCAYDTHFM